MIWMHPLWLAALLLLPLPWLFLRRRESVPFSDNRLLGSARGNRWLHRLPLAAFTIAMALVVVSLARPQVREESPTQVIQSRDIIIAVDISGSMGGLFDGEIPKADGPKGELDKDFPGMPKPKPGQRVDPNLGKRRIDAAQSAVLRFVRHRYEHGAGDRIGVQVFDDAPRWSWPLTDDLKMIYRKGLFLTEGALQGGTNFGGWSPGPFDAAIEHFDERGQAASKVMIILTDGESSIGSDVMARLQSEFEARGIRLYVIGVGEELSRGNFDIFRFAQLLGGPTFRVQNGADMAKCFDSIDELERSPVEVATESTYGDVFHYFAIAALSFFCLSVLGRAVIVSN